MRKNKGAFLTWEEVSKSMSYNPKTGEVKWKRDVSFKMKAGKKAGTIQKNQGAYKIRYEGVTIYRSIWAFFLMTKRWPKTGYVISHLDGNVSNDRWTNLRERTNSECRRNMKLYKNNSTGVSFISKQNLRSKKYYLFSIRKGVKLRPKKSRV